MGWAVPQACREQEASRMRKLVLHMQGALCEMPSKQWGRNPEQLNLRLPTRRSVRIECIYALECFEESDPAGTPKERQASNQATG